MRIYPKANPYLARKFIFSRLNRSPSSLNFALFLVAAPLAFLAPSTFFDLIFGARYFRMLAIYKKANLAIFAHASLV